MAPSDAPATAVALLTAPAFFLVLYESNHLSLIASLIITVLAVLVFRGLVEVVARKLIPSPACPARARLCVTRTWSPAAGTGGGERGSAASRTGSPRFCSSSGSQFFLWLAA